MKQLLALSFVFIIIGCNSKMNEKEQLLNADRQFSALSEEKGVNTAFMEYLADGGVMLRPNSMPFVGRESIADLFKDDDSGYTLVWEPLDGEVASSGDFGYTYGIYELTANGKTNKGTYVSVWKKDREGNWKYVLDSGNSGVGE